MVYGIGTVSAGVAMSLFQKLMPSTLTGECTETINGNVDELSRFITNVLHDEFMEARIDVAVHLIF